MKDFLIILLLSITSVVTSQTPQASRSITVGENYQFWGTMESKVSFARKNSNGDYLIIRKDKTDWTWRNYLMIMDENLNLKESRVLNKIRIKKGGATPSPNYNLIFKHQTDSTIFYYYAYTDIERQTQSLYLEKHSLYQQHKGSNDKTYLSAIGEPTLLATLDISTKRDYDTGFFIRYSPDSSKFLILCLEGKEKYGTIIYDKTGNRLWDNNFTWNPDKQSTESVFVDNKGNLIIALSDKTMKSETYTVVKYLFESGKLLKHTFSYDAKIYDYNFFSSKDKIYLLGHTKSNVSNTLSGTYCIILEEFTLKPICCTNKTFPPNFIIEKQKKDNLFIVNTRYQKCEDGGFYQISEHIDNLKYSHTSYATIFYHSSIYTIGAGQEHRNHSFKDIYITRYSAEGKVKWQHKIKKNQVAIMPDYTTLSDRFMSYTSVYYDSTLYLIFNDNSKNTDSNKTKPFKVVYPASYNQNTKGQLVMVSITNDGIIKKETLMEAYNTNDEIFSPINSFLVSENELIMLGYSTTEERVCKIRL